MNLNKSMILSFIISMSFNSASFAMHEIHDAAVRGDLDSVRELLQAGADIDAQEPQFGYSPLHYAAIRGHLNIVVFLLQNRAAVNVQCAVGLTPLHYAVMDNRANVVQVLLEHRAIVDVREKDRQRTPLHLAREENIARILLDYGANVGARDDAGSTPLHCATSVDVARLLLVHRADVDAQDKNGKTPFDYAEEKKYHNVAQFLKDWSLYKNFLRRQVLAFAMVTHPRLGEHSAARVLDPASRRYISMMVAYPSHTLEEIHEMAEQERRIQQSAQ